MKLKLVVMASTLAIVAGCSGGSAPPPTEGAGGAAPAGGGGSQINGAGATFPNPIYSKWFAEYNKLHADIQINYQPHQLLGYAPLPESVVKLEMAALAQVKIS